MISVWKSPFEKDGVMMGRTSEQWLDILRIVDNLLEHDDWRMVREVPRGFFEPPATIPERRHAIPSVRRTFAVLGVNPIVWPEPPTFFVNKQDADVKRRELEALHPGASFEVVLRPGEAFRFPYVDGREINERVSQSDKIWIVVEIREVWIASLDSGLSLEEAERKAQAHDGRFQGVVIPIASGPRRGPVRRPHRVRR